MEILRQLQKGAVPQTYLRGLAAVSSSRLSVVLKGKSDDIIHGNRKVCNGNMRHFAPISHKFPILLIRNGALLQTQASVLTTNQACSYHSLLRSVNSYQRTEKDLLSTCLTVSATNTMSKRDLSMAWLESLTVFQASWFQSLAESRFVEGLMGGLQVIHDSLHVPWWSSIIISTIILRGLLTFPLAVYQNYILSKVENLKGELDALAKELGRETALATKKFGWTQTHARYMFNRSVSELRKDLIVRENCHPFKASLVLWFQIPLWIGMSVSLRNMASMMPHQDTAAQILFLELSTGGVSWIPNLIEVDHSLILPLAMGITNLLITEVNALSRVSKSRMQVILTNVFRGISIAIIPIAATMPSCVVLYWVTSSVCALIQNLALMHPQLRQACGIPKTPSQIPKPYQHLLSQLQNRFTRRKS
ncbi:cytochrome c oxidase assembly protein COX18, mitochondrial [Macrobrachium rosenbergii]|uniref:cytochrome c oxidase assembly protein COX18, mitochondrial n=1 Tax=Macrobrachium rosenbergii TaxID=79674 RepID=UPI0034D62CD3